MCRAFLRYRSNAATNRGGSGLARLACDESFASPDGNLSVNGGALLGLCEGKFEGGILSILDSAPSTTTVDRPFLAGVCAGLERVLWHHCGRDPSPGAFDAGAGEWLCRGRDEDPGNPSFCEGYTVPTAGEDFVTSAAAATYEVIRDAASAWTGVCHQPDFDGGKCSDVSCATWCQRSTFLRPASVAAGRVVTGTCAGANASCSDEHPTCVCFVGRGEPGGSPDWSPARSDGSFWPLLGADSRDSNSQPGPASDASKAAGCALSPAQSSPGNYGLPGTSCPAPDAQGSAMCDPGSRFCTECGGNYQPCCPVDAAHPGCDSSRPESRNNRCHDHADNVIAAPPNTCAAWRDFHCSACDKVCGPTASCCGNECVDRSRDPRNCGNCAVSCPDGHVCLSGVCGPVGGTATLRLSSPVASTTTVSAALYSRGLGGSSHRSNARTLHINIDDSDPSSVTYQQLLIGTIGYGGPGEYVIEGGHPDPPFMPYATTVQVYALSGSAEYSEGWALDRSHSGGSCKLAIDSVTPVLASPPPTTVDGGINAGLSKGQSRILGHIACSGVPGMSPKQQPLDFTAVFDTLIDEED